MKILYHQRTASKTGQSVHIEELVTAFEKLDHAVIMTKSARDKVRKIGKQNKLISFIKKNIPLELYELAELAYSLVEFWRLRRDLIQNKPHVLYQRYNLFTLSGLILKKIYGIPFFLEVNSPLLEERSKYNGLKLRRLARWTQEQAWRGADMTFPVSEALAKYLRAAGVPDERITVTHNGINEDRFYKDFDRGAEKAKLGLENRIVLGFSGFIHEWHRLDMILDVMAQALHFPIHLIVVGDGTPRPQLEAKAKQLGLSDRLTFTGVVERKRMPAYISTFDIAIQPGVTAYASPLKLFEYMALGCAIVAPRSPSIEEILTNDKDALLFRRDDCQSLAAQILKLCASEELRQKLGAQAKLTILERDYTWIGNARRIAALVPKQASAVTQKPHAKYFPGIRPERR
ncbi:MAG: glycosyltransferase family 4 protein [Hyphomicrobiales bacterium]|nr:glycosyltransferase family 4 protein [Hyphomicrobiales bacterium]